MSKLLIDLRDLMCDFLKINVLIIEDANLVNIIFFHLLQLVVLLHLLL